MYRMLTAEEIAEVAAVVKRRAAWEEAMEFAENLFGPRAQRVEVQVQSAVNDGQPGIVQVVVFDADDTVVDPDVTTAWWQDLIARIKSDFDPNDPMDRSWAGGEADQMGYQLMVPTIDPNDPALWQVVYRKDEPPQVPTQVYVFVPDDPAPTQLSLDPTGVTDLPLIQAIDHARQA